MTAALQQFVRREDGQDLVEYALLAGLLSVVCILVLNTVGESVTELFTEIGAALRNA